MKNSFRVFALILVALFSVAFIGCGGDDEDEAGGDIVTPAATPTPMEQLAGKYTATEVAVAVDGVSVVLRPPNVFGQFNLSAGGGSWSMNYVFDGGDKVDESGSFWSADGTNFSLDGEPVPYTWDGTYLLLILTADVRVKWQKL